MVLGKTPQALRPGVVLCEGAAIDVFARGERTIAEPVHASVDVASERREC